MSSEAQIQARADRLDDAEYDSLKKSLHGIAARLDRLPIGSWHWKLLWLFGGAMFLDNLDMYIGGCLIASLLADGWSTIEWLVPNHHHDRLPYRCTHIRFGRRSPW